MMPEYTKAYLEGFCNGESAIKQKIKDKKIEVVSRCVELLGPEQYYVAIKILDELLEDIEELLKEN